MCIRDSHFHCHADTEVLVHGYEEWGTRLVHRLRGMYGFVIWDKANRRLFGARDMFGIKPFYYSPLPGGKGLLFGSEIKGFLEHPLFCLLYTSWLHRAFAHQTRRASRRVFYRFHGGALPLRH